jgi:hypothetical protein
MTKQRYAKRVYVFFQIATTSRSLSPYIGFGCLFGDALNETRSWADTSRLKVSTAFTSSIRRGFKSGRVDSVHCSDPGVRSSPTSKISMQDSTHHGNSSYHSRRPPFSPSSTATAEGLHAMAPNDCPEDNTRPSVVAHEVNLHNVAGNYIDQRTTTIKQFSSSPANLEASHAC